MGDDAWLDDCDEVFFGDFFDAVHAHGVEDDAAVDGNAATDVTFARTARGDGDTVLLGKLEETLDIGGGLGKDDGLWRVRGKPCITGIRSENGGICGELFLREQFFEFEKPGVFHSDFLNLVVAGENKNIF
jgi:hypothetical protein